MSHHRQHAIDFLDVVSDKIAETQIALGVFSSQLDVTNLSINEQTAREFIRQATIALANSGKLIVDAVSKLHDPDPAVLEEVRALLNNPREQSSYDDRSLLYWCHYAILFFAGLIGGDPEKPINDALRSINDAWRDTDFALWHINDAIREEVYNDQDFAP